jgi:RNA polymerase sigma factor (sigma-70 family)
MQTMIDISPEQIRAAAANDLTAIGDVLAALEPRIGQVASRYATNGTTYNANLYEELQQEGRIAAWQCISRFEGTDVAQFFTYVDRTLRGVMDDKRRTETRQGVSNDTALRFERCLSVSGGDPYEAEREATRATGCLGRDRMLPDLAYAARMAWQGMAHLDGPVRLAEVGGAITLGEMVADTYEVAKAEADDQQRGRRKAIAEAVHTTLSRMGKQQAFVLRATFGIEPAPHMERDAEIAEALDVPEKRITVMRSKGKNRFRELYLAGANGVAEIAA